MMCREFGFQLNLREGKRTMSLAVILLVLGFVAIEVPATIVQPEWKIYYNITTNETIDVIDSNNPRSQYYKTKSVPRVLRIGFGPIPCSCQEFTCGCCAGINVNYFDFNRRACMNFTYDPYEFSLMLDMLMNDESVFSQRVSGKNPPPACIPMPLPLPFAPTIDFCVKLFNIHTPGYNLFMCMDFETRITRAPVLILHFDCMQMGADGVHHLKPEDAQIGPTDVEAPDGGPVQPEVEIEVYDEVFEEDKKNATEETGVKESKSPPNQAPINASLLDVPYS